MTLTTLALTSFGGAFSGAMMPGPMLITLPVIESSRGKGLLLEIWLVTTE